MQTQQEGLRTNLPFRKKNPGIFKLEIPEKTMLNPWKFQSLKPKPMEIPHDFLLITPGNSTSLLPRNGVTLIDFQGFSNISVFKLTITYLHSCIYS